MTRKAKLESERIQTRKYYRHRDTGELGYLWKNDEDGNLYIRLDRPNQRVLREVTKHQSEWLPEVEYRPFARGQITRILYAADRELRVLLGEVRPTEFESLRDRQRIEFMNDGPESGLRRDVYLAIQEILLPLCR